jgi:hydroxymethylbilane synthase
MILAVCRKQFPDQQFEIVGLSTSGDKVLNKPIAQLGSTGVFVKELEDALLQNQVDFVVHSLKDLPTLIPDGLCLAATLLRDDPRDVFVSRNNVGYLDLPKGSRVATSSRRRAAQLNALRDDLEFVDVRGNVPTRLRKLDENHCDGMVLAAAGLHRLGFADRIAHYFEPEASVPAAGQGALGVECRADDQRVRALLGKINEATVWAEATAERAFLAKLGGGCSVPIGVLARCDDEEIHIVACVADGKRLVRGESRGPQSVAHALGVTLAEDMLEQGAGEILEALLQKPQQTISPP